MAIMKVILSNYNPGGITDILARALAQPLTALLGNTVVARAAPDGLTLLLGVTDTHAVNPAAMRNLPYDAERDFDPATLIPHDRWPLPSGQRSGMSGICAAPTMCCFASHELRHEPVRLSLGRRLHRL